MNKVHNNNVSDPDPDLGGSGFKSPVWIRIRIKQLKLIRKRRIRIRNTA